MYFLNYTKKIIFLTLFFSFTTLFAKSQAPVIDWQKSIGGIDEDAATQIQPTPDGGYIVVGSTKSTSLSIPNHGGWDIFVVKMNSAGNVQWQKCYGGSNAELGYTIATTSDGGYIIGGETNSQDGDVTGNTFGIIYNHAWIVKINSTGDIQWQKFINGGLIGSKARSIIQTTDGGYLFVGNAYAAMSTFSYDDAWVVKLTSVGAVSWALLYGGNYHDSFESVVQTTDGGYAIAGSTASSNLPNYHAAVTGITFDFFIVKINNLGALIWQKLYGGTGGDMARSIIQTSDGGFAVAGYNGGNSGEVTGNKGFDDAWLLKLNNVGNLLWQKSYGGSTNDDASSLVENNDGTITMACTAGSTDGDITNFINLRDFWIVKANGTNGNIIWQKKYGGGNRDDAYSIKATADGGYIVAGYATFDGGDVTGNNGYIDYWILKLKGNITVPNISNFFAQKVNNNLVLSWQVVSNTNVQLFKIQHSLDSTTWITIGNVLAGAVYTFTHTTPAIAKNYYRLEQVNNNTTKEYSTIKMVEFLPNNALILYPNPATNFIWVLFNEPIITPLTYTIYNANGAAVLSGLLSNNIQKINLPVLLAGLYRLKLSDGEAQNFLKN
jgi:Secretion system C-terminal sorting domain